MNIASLLQAANNGGMGVNGTINPPNINPTNPPGSGSTSPYGLDDQKLHIPSTLDGLSGDELPTMAGGYTYSPPLMNPEKIYESSVRILYMRYDY